MGDLNVTRWRKYGHDRLYVKTASSGSEVGWMDLHTWRVTLQRPELADDFHSAIATFCHSNAVQIPGGSDPSPAHPRPASSDIAVEAEQWLVQQSTAGCHEPYAVRIDWRDTARNAPGQRAAEQAATLRAAAPVREFLNRVMGVRTDERAWRIGSDGERLVAAELAKLEGQWHSLHAVEVGKRGADIDHIVMGPAGVFTVNAKHHPRSRVWVGGNTFIVNGQRYPYIRNSRHEAARASRLLTSAAGFNVCVRGVIAVVNAGQLQIKTQPPDVQVVARGRLVEWLQRQPVAMSPDALDHLWRVARKSTTWKPA